MQASISPLYQTVNNRPYYCVPSCIQMVLKRRNLPVVSLEEIGKNLGIIIPGAGIKKPPYGWGTRLDIPRYSLNNFLEKENIPLKCSKYHFNNISEFSQFVTYNLLKGKDILAIYRYGTLYHKNIPWGHASLIQSIKGTKIKLKDPNDNELKSVTIDNLVEALVNHQMHGKSFGSLYAIYQNTKDI
jgi:hypothetical protein